MWLQLRMYMLVAIMGFIIFAFLLFVGAALGYSGQSFVNYTVIMALGMMFLQYIIGPKTVESSMQVRYVTENEDPRLYQMVEEQAMNAGLKKVPKVGISPTPMPNAFAFGRSIGDARVCVTQGIRNLLSEDELKAVIGHEISHVKHRDMAIITLLSAIPMIAYYMYMSSLYSRGYSSSGNRNTIGASMVGIVALVIYGITNLLVMYGSRIREYYADKGSVEIGNEPHQLASALYKLTYGTAKTPNQEVQRVEGIKAFFLNDPTKAKGDFNELTEVDSNMSGTIDRHELESVRQGGVRVGASASIMELMSTHPNMLKRIKHLSELSR